MRPLAVAAVAAVALVVLFLLAASVWTHRLQEETGAPRTVAGGRPEALPALAAVAIEWPSALCYPRALVADCLAAVRPAGGRPAEYGPASEAERQRLADAAAEIGRRHRVALRPAVLESVRNLELAHSARTSGVRAQRFGPQIAKARRAGEAVVDIARRLRLPPLAVLKQALIEEGHSGAQVKRMVSRPGPALEPEVRAASEADLGSALHAGRARAAAQAFEDAVAAYLRKLGAAFETEAGLRAAGATAPAGVPPLTPDFLFTAPTRINGTPVGWLDAKNYPGVDSPLLLKGLQRQAAKYTARLGPGAFVFSGGYVCDSALGGGETPVLLLDGSHLLPAATKDTAG